MNIDYDDQDNSLWVEIKSTINYVITNYHKFILLILTFFIIYFVDYISSINAFIYSSQDITSLKTPLPSVQLQMKIPRINQKNRKKSKK